MRRRPWQVAATVAGAVCSTLLFGALRAGAASGLRCLARGPTAAAGAAHQRSAAVWSRTIRAPRVGAGSRKGRHCQTARPGLRLRGDYETRDARRACSPTLGVVSFPAGTHLAGACARTGHGQIINVLGAARCGRSRVRCTDAWRVTFRRVLCVGFTAPRAPICRGRCSQRRRGAFRPLVLSPRDTGRRGERRPSRAPADHGRGGGRGGDCHGGRGGAGDGGAGGARQRNGRGGGGGTGAGGRGGRGGR